MGCQLRTKYYLYLITLLLCSGVQAQSTNEPYVIPLKVGAIQLPIQTHASIDSIALATQQAPIQVLLQFYQLPNASVRDSLGKSGINLLQYMGGNAYSSLWQSTSTTYIPYHAIRSIHPMLPEWKIDASVKEQIATQRAVVLSLTVAFVKGNSQATVEKILQENEAIITDKRFAAQGVYGITVSADNIQHIAMDASVTYLSLAHTIVPLNYDDRAMTGAAMMSMPLAAGGWQLDGKGITIGVGDNSSGLFHTDTRDRITNFNPDPMELHGQHVTGTIAGMGIINPRGKGMAPASNVLAHLYDLVWAQTPNMFTHYNMTLTNNSYAAVINDCAVAGTYDIYTQLLDDNAIQYPKVLNVFAAGNDGNKNCPPYPQGYGTIVGIYQPAKNILTVSSIRKTYTVHEGASKGPVKDGRIKPEVVSFGAGVFSCALSDNYQAINGTSMACPGAVGALSLLTQRYKQLHSNNLPDNALLKALMVNGAIDVGTAGPDYINGFGLINLYRSLDMLHNNRMLSNTITQGASQNFSISIPTNTAQVKVLLYWNDEGASPAATAALVNNLDLTVTTPNNTLHRPLILDPTPANVTQPATEGIDNLNNIEQVVINNPSSGNYTITVAGSSIPSISQNYYVVYDIVPTGITLKYPHTGAAIPANETVTIFWDASDDTQLLTLEYSDNNGATWNTISNTIAANAKHYNWNVPNVSTTQALVRISRNNTTQQHVSGQFSINPTPTLQLESVQCPGYFSFSWNAIPNATAYQVLQKIGDDLRAVDTVSNTTYTLKGLAIDSIYYVAVAPIISGVAGFRSNALKRKPDNGNCSGTISDNDLMLARVVSPLYGRKGTKTELHANETLQLMVQNLDNVPANSFRISYKVNNNGWQSQILNTPLAANAATLVAVGGLNLASTGIYSLTIAIENLSGIDPVSSNDTLTTIVKHLSNPLIDISNIYHEDFEASSPITLLKEDYGVVNDHWDFENSTDSGRLRNFVSSDVIISGNRSISMDLLYNLPENRNYLYGTFNLSGTQVQSDEARLELDYKWHGTPKWQEGNDIYVRGNDTAVWVKLFDMDTTVTKGKTTNTGSLSLTHALSGAGQQFSSSFQIRIGQHDTSAIAANDYGNGLTLDNVKLYTVKNDVQLLRVVTPIPFHCNLSQPEKVSVLVYNSDNLPQNNIVLYYRFDQGNIVSDTLTFLAPKDTALFVFKQTIDASTKGWHQLDVWLIAAGDTYLPNDSLLQYRFRNQPIISQFPYLEDFETTEGFWYTDGDNSSWQHGVPAGVIIKQAASGTKAWKTNLGGRYNNNERSYLYSPCYDISQLAAPMLSFSMATDIENCGSNLCDRAHLEYSEDGIVWQKLGVKDSGTNWYNSDAQVWNEQNNPRWRVSTYALPKLPSLKLRFVFTTDMGSAFDGISIDDIHIYDYQFPIFDEAFTNPITQSGASQPRFMKADKILGSLDDSSFSSSIQWNAYNHSSVYVPYINQYFLSKNYALHSSIATTGLRFYITDKEFLQLYQSNECASCTLPTDVYRLGILHYQDPDASSENGFWLDNSDGNYQFITPQNIRWVPYGSGYYAAINAVPNGEYWFTTGIPTHTTQGVNIYPNPIQNNSFNLSWMGQRGDKMTIRVLDILGKEVFATSLTATDIDNVSTLILPTLSGGVYIVKYASPLQSGEGKIVIR